MGGGSAASSSSRSSSVTREARAESMSVSCYQERRDCKSLLFSLLWYIGGAPPVLRNRELKVSSRLPRVLGSNVRWVLPLLLLNCLFLSSNAANSQQQWCGQTLEQQVIKVTNMKFRQMSNTTLQCSPGKCHLADITWKMSPDMCHLESATC